MATDISFDDLIPTKQQGSSTPSKRTNISFDDLIPKEPEARPSTTPIIEGEGGAAFGMYSKPGLQSGPTSDSASRLGRNIYRTGGEAIVPTGAGLAGFGAGMAIAAPYAASAAAATAATGVGAPFAPIVGGAVVLGGGFGGAMVASGAAKKVQDLMHKTFAPEDYAQRQIEKEAYPTSTFVTELGVGMAGMSPRTAVSAVSDGASRAARFVASPIGQRTVSGGLQGGIEAGTEYAETGTIEPLKVAAATAAGAAMPGFNIAGRIPFVAGQKIGEKISSVLPGGVRPIKPTISDLPPKPPEGSPPEEIDAYITKLEAIKAEHDAKTPIVEAAIRNKSNPNDIERMGPKHDEQRKLETFDTHEQGFVDENGNFLTRQEAVDRAKNTGQLPKDYVPEVPEVGLRSDDLRKAGDKRFEITDLTQKPFDPNELISRQDFKTAIDDKEFRLGVSLEIDMVEAQRRGDTKGLEELKAEEARLTAELEQLRKDIPTVKFADINKPTWVELHDHLWGTKSMGEALERIIQTPSLGTVSQRYLAKALNKSDFINSARLEFSNDLIKYVDKNGVEQQDARGVYTGGDRHLVELGKGGNVRVLLHEAIHAGTQRLLSEKGSAAAIKMQELFDKYQATHGKEIDPATGEPYYGFEDVHEFAAEAFTSKRFQKLLSGISVGQQPKGVLNNLWGAFKEVVRQANGVPEGARTAFDEVMDSGISILAKSKGFKRDASGDIIASPSRLSQEIQDQLEREGIAIAHTSPYKFGMFDWVKNALSGEGANAFGAGTYGSQKDSTNRYYVEMAKQKALDKYLESPEGKADKTKLDANKRQAIRAHQRLNDLGERLENIASDKDSLRDQLIGPESGIKDTAKRTILKLEALEKQLNEDYRLAKEDVLNIEFELEFKRKQLKEKVKVPTYHSSIKATSDELLDWNSNQQSKLVSDAFKNLGIESANKLDKTTELKINQALKDGWYGNLGEDGSVGITVLGRDYVVHANDLEFMPDGTPKINSLVVGRTGEIVTSFEQAKKSVLEMILSDQGYVQKTGEQLYTELSKKFEPTDKATRNLITDREAKQIGQAKASIALAEQGVVGNVHNAQGGVETKFRNYVVFDDSRITQNFVTLASKEKKTISSSPDELPVDKTKTDPRDVKSEEEFYDIAAEIFAKHGKVAAVEFYEGYKEYKKTWLEPTKEIEKFIGTNLNQKQANELFIHNKTAELKEMAGKDVNLEQLTYDIDKGVTLTGKAKEVATKFRTLMDEIGKRALEKGVIKGWHEDYVARNVVSEGNAPKGALEEFMRDVFGYGEKASGEGTKTTTKYGQERKLKSREDLVNHINGINEWLEAKGLDYRFKLKTDNLADIYKDYALSIEKAIENKNLIDNIKQIRNDNGESLIKKIDDDNPLPYQWKQIDHPDLAGYAVHPDLVPHLKFVFDAGPGKLMSALGSISQWTKFLNVIGSFFHAKSLMEVLSSAKIPIWTPFKEAIVLPAVELAVKKITGKELQLSAITKALDQFRKAGVGGNVDMWIKSELTFEMPEDATRGLLTSLGKFSDSMIGKYGPKTRVLESSLSLVEKNTLGLFNKYTWDYLHTGGKLFVADAYLDKARMKAAKEGKPFDEMAVRKEIARFVNEGFGGLNWYDIVRQTEGEFAKRMSLAAYSPAGRRGLQVLLFAPDWTISTLRAFTAALPKGLNPTKWQPVEGIKGMMTPTTKADYARLYQFKTALTYLTLYNAINIMTAGRPIWENKDPTRIEYPDGTSMQAAKHAMEPYHWIMDPVKTLSNKLGFVPKAAIITIAGTEYASPDAPKLVDRSILGRLKAAGSGALPFQAQAAMSAPEGEGAKRALLGTLGFPVYGGTPEQKKAARAEREKLLKKQAKEYHEKAKLRGWEK